MFDATKRRRRKRAGAIAPLVLAAIALIAPGPAAAATTTLEPVADAYVTAARPKANFGRARTLVVGGRQRARSYLRFRVQTSLPIARAVLKLTPRRGSTRGLGPKAVAGRWSERRISFANAPGVAAATASRAHAVAKLNVTKLVRGPGSVTFMLTGPRRRTIRLASREAPPGMRPRLVLATTDSPPAPLPPFPPPPLPGPPKPPHVNHAPVVSSASLDRSRPDTDDVLTASARGADADGDAVTLRYQWLQNGAALAGRTGRTLDLSGAGNGDRGDRIQVRVTASDGSATSAPLTSAVSTVANTPPVVSSVSIGQPSVRTDDTLTAMAASRDLDGDSVSIEYQWLKDGQPLAGETGPALDLSEPGNGDKGDAISVRVVARDDEAGSAALVSAARIVANSAPALRSVVIDQPSPGTETLLTVTVDDVDADGDPLTASYQWLRNGQPLDGETGPTLDLSEPGNGDKGDDIRVRVTASDGSADSAPVTSEPRTVANTPPALASVAIDRASPRTDDVLTATVGGDHDVDGDALSFEYQWLKNGEPLDAETGSTLDLSKAGNGDKGDEIAVSVVADDGSATSDPATSPAATVANSAPSCKDVTLDVMEDTAGEVAPDCADADGDTLTYSIVADGTLGTASLADGKLRYAPDPDVNGSDAGVTYAASDGAADSAPGSLAVTIAEVNDPPVVTVDDRTVVDEESAAVSINVKGNDDPGPANEDAQHLELDPGGVGDPPNGLAFYRDASRVTYQPDSFFNGDDVFEYTVCDDGTTAGAPDPKCATGTVAVTVARPIAPTVETVPVAHSGDAADDTAVWVNSADPAKSTIIGTDKLGGLDVYDLGGAQLQDIASTTRMNNVDLRAGVPLGGDTVSLAAATNRSTADVDVYRVDPATGTLDPTKVGSFSVDFQPYGFCLYRDPDTHALSAFVTRDDVGNNNPSHGQVEQWALTESPTQPGTVVATKVRTLMVGSLVEGCVADDEHRALYLAEEDVAIWRYDADPDGGDARTKVDTTGPSGHLRADIEGLTIAADPSGGTGHLIASSQGNSTYAVYALDAGNTFVRSARIPATDDNAIDAVSGTDGIEASGADLGPAFPNGVLVVQDDKNQTPTSGTAAGANQNYKLVPLEPFVEAPASPPPAPPPSDPTIVAAGDIAYGGTGDDETADLLDALDPTVVATLGDNAYDEGTLAQYQTYYGPTWGRHKAITRPAPGNHDYETPDAAGYFDYFGDAAGPRGEGWYSYDVGDWHVVVLNTNGEDACATISCAAGSEQEQWLRADLAAHPAACVLAYWHHPRFSRGPHGDSPGVAPLFEALYDFDADVVLAGHDHTYQRWAPMTAGGEPDPARGIRSFVVGTGGKDLYELGTDPNLEAAENETSGVLDLTLHPDGYDWRFVPVAGGTYADSGTAACH